MGFGQQSGPPASAKQVEYLKALVQKAGHDGFRDARGPLSLTQRQAGGKFTRNEASALIDQLLGTSDGGDGGGDSGEAPEPEAARDAQLTRQLRDMPAGLLAGELERRGWVVTLPPPG